MRARTAADLTALFADLPQAEEVPAGVDNGRRELTPAGPPPRPPRALRRGGRTMRGLVLAVLLVLGVAVAANVVTHSVLAWALLLILAAAWLLRRGVRE
jgi:hypothetical protein